MACSESKEPTTSCEAGKHTDDEEDKSVTLVEILEEEAQLEEDANAVLGGSDDANCTYRLGYINRQALYACVTCRKQSGNTQLAGICLACSYHCHDGHELIELYTKRNFCCDCGNSKFPSNKCTLATEKSDVNENNSYNHNFMGKYCTCQKPYPDPEDSNPDEMVQCIMCEDWHHNKHLGKTPPPDSDYSEMICDACMEKHPFLNAYSSMIDSAQSSSSSCKLESETIDKDEMNSKKATFWPEGWRNRLCRCEKCLAMYEEKKIKYLTDDQDTVEHYEQKGKMACVNRPSSNERLMEALSSLDRIQQVEAITEYQSFATELKDYLKTFADNKRVVREEDITEFFGRLKERKRRRLDDGPAGMNHFCR